MQLRKSPSRFTSLTGTGHGCLGISLSVLHRYAFSSQPQSNADLDFEAARKWYQRLGGNPVAQDIGEITYSRSSGPGGQNVNKVNSKAQLRVPLDRLLPILPSVLHSGIRASRYYAAKTSSLLIQSDESRKQSANRDTCYRHLNDLIVDVYKNTVPGETSEDQKRRVQGLKKRENESRLKLKKHIASKKANRRDGDE